MARTISMCILATILALQISSVAGGDNEIDEHTITGTIVYNGRPYPEPHMMKLPKGTVLDESLLVHAKNGGIANAIITLSSSAIVKSASPKPNVVAIQATDSGFSPHVVVMYFGDTLQIDNMGKTGTVINIATVRNQPENKLLGAGQQTTFAPLWPEKWPIFVSCSIKPWMQAWVVVSASPHVAVTDENGRFQFRDLTPGDYDVTIWHERAGKVKDQNLQNPAFRRTTKGYRLRLERPFGDLGRILLEASQFETK